ncbi:MAG: hypothetical protein J0H79_14195 [Alphaproteobacteria bacterium]|nr:hypothetical protein [Alphaproteobacteria bacterium]OJU57338.1 MAG: hypothetical protein BGO00_04575 [Alphaproteobacteria bacterium 62-8]
MTCDPNHRQSVRRRWSIVMAGASHDEEMVRLLFPRLALEHDLIVYIEELEAKNNKATMAAASEREARHKLDMALRLKDQAMSALFERMAKAGVDFSDFIS